MPCCHHLDNAVDRPLTGSPVQRAELGFVVDGQHGGALCTESVRREALNPPGGTRVSLGLGDRTPYLPKIAPTAEEMNRTIRRAWIRWGSRSGL
jgi:hypothetical protein